MLIKTIIPSKKTSYVNLGEKVEIFNQVAETLKVRDLATLIAAKTGVEIRNLENPRKEDAENELQVSTCRIVG